MMESSSPSRIRSAQPPDIALLEELPAQPPDTTLQEEMKPPDSAILELLPDQPVKPPEFAFPEELHHQSPDSASLEEVPDQLPNNVLQPPDTPTPPKKVGCPVGPVRQKMMTAPEDSGRARIQILTADRPPSSSKTSFLPVPGRGKGRPKKAFPPPTAPPVSRPVPAARPRIIPGSQTRKTLYLLGKIVHPSTPLGFAKLPKLQPILKKVLGIVEEEKVTKAEAVKKVTAEITDIWQHHFGPRVIRGKDYPEQDIKAEMAEEKKMVISESKISEKIRLSLDKFEKLEYESRRVVKRNTFPEQEAQFTESLKKPLNILKTGCWKKRKINGVKERAWSLSGEEVLQHSGILSWQEDLQHLRNQLTEEQPGTCHGADVKQMRRDDRILKRKLGAQITKEKKDSQDLEVSSRVDVDEVVAKEKANETNNESKSETDSEADEDECSRGLGHK